VKRTGRNGPQAGPIGWTNWAGNQTASPLLVQRPTTETELCRVVEQSAHAKRTIRAVGSGHSFTAAAVANQTLIDLRGYNQVLNIDNATGLVQVQAGLTLADLNQALDKVGLAMPNLGDIEYQTVSGAISTGTHGTGALLGGLATQIREMRIVNAEGSIETLTGDQLKLGVVSLGCLGIISTLTIQCVPSFLLHVVNEPMKLDKVFGRFDELADTNDHFEFYWVPHTKWALTKQNNRTDRPLLPRSKSAALANDYLFENVAFGALTKLGKIRPSLIPRLATAAPSSGRVEFVDKSHNVFVSPRLVKFVEQEYAIPRAATCEALQAITAMVERKNYNISFPVEVRVTAADELGLSTATGRESGYIAVHMTKGSDHRAYFRDVEDILRSHDGRPHWGKLHTRTYDNLSATYKRMDDFQSLRQKMDPLGLFSNPYVNQVLGDIS
jgi:L-gulono-1,4-lactone dehydrogenase